MGLDMYLTGRKYLHNVNNGEPLLEDGFELQQKHLRLGYWRKHPDLHGFIVREFNAGVDDCSEIFLDADALRTIIKAVEDDELPETEGFFFGSSDGSEKEEDLSILNAALAWLETKETNVWRDVYYQASW